MNKNPIYLNVDSSIENKEFYAIISDWSNVKEITHNITKISKEERGRYVRLGRYSIKQFSNGFLWIIRKKVEKYINKENASQIKAITDIYIQSELRCKQ